MLKGNFASIKLDFENMESITIPKTAIKSIDFRGLTQQRLKYNKKSDRNGIIIEYDAEYCEIQLDRKYLMNDNIRTFSGYTLKQRINYWNDIVNVDVIFNDHTIESIYLPWNGNEDNKWQKSYSVKEQNTLVINIHNPKFREI